MAASHRYECNVTRLCTSNYSECKKFMSLHTQHPTHAAMDLLFICISIVISLIATNYRNIRDLFRLREHFKSKTKVIND